MLFLFDVHLHLKLALYEVYLRFPFVSPSVKLFEGYSTFQIVD